MTNQRLNSNPKVSQRANLGDGVDGYKNQSGSNFNNQKDPVKSFKKTSKTTPKSLKQLRSESELNKKQIALRKLKTKTKSYAKKTGLPEMSYRQQLLQIAHSQEFADRHSFRQPNPLEPYHYYDTPSEGDLIDTQTPAPATSTSTLPTDHSSLPLETSSNGHTFDAQRLDRDLNEVQTNRYYRGLLGLSLGFLFLYFFGSSLLIFLANLFSQAGAIVLPQTSLTTDLLVSDFGLYTRALLTQVFSPFIRYFKSFGLLSEFGVMNVSAKPLYILPIDILIKTVFILGIQFLWLSKDRFWISQLGVFSRSYFSRQKPIVSPAELEADLENSLADEFPVASGYLQPSLRPHVEPGEVYFSNDSSDLESFANFSSDTFLHRWYFRNEERVYQFLRYKVLPALNILLIIYFSTTIILDLTRPILSLLYFCGVAAMLWCMHNFLLVLDHSQNPPEEA
jgi:hypothetical protein